MEAPAQALFEAVALRDYESLVQLFGLHAQHAVLSYLAMQERCNSNNHSTSQAHQRQQGDTRSEEKLDEFLQQLYHNHQTEMMPWDAAQAERSRVAQDQQSFSSLLRELSVFLTEHDGEKSAEQQQPTTSSDRRQHQRLKTKKIEISPQAEDLLRDAAAMLSASRPPNNFVVYNDGRSEETAETPHQQQQNSSAATSPPLFDGSVANATPPPMGGGASGATAGAGTILHLACALDVPLALAFLLAMGADARASHTAFRRLMIHEAACNGSFQCLTLLLELGERFGDGDASNHSAPAASSSPPNIRRPGSRSSSSLRSHPGVLPFMPRRIDREQALGPARLFAQHPEFFGVPPSDRQPTTDFLSLLRLFRDVSKEVTEGKISELDASREILKHADLEATSKAALARSCGFRVSDSPYLFRPRSAGNGTSDGHGNTPLHWAAFKNETKCVSLLLHFNADPNARAHPSGWTPLHDAAYSNSRETIELLLNAGAEVDARANSGATPLCFAAQEDAASAASLLLERGADLTARCAGGPVRDDGTVAGRPHQSRFSGYTPLHYCAHYNAHRAAHVLLKHSTARRAMEIADLNDRLPIHVAVARGSSDVLRELLHAGARVETRLKRTRSGTDQQQQQHLRSWTPPPPPQRRQPPTPESLSSSSSRDSSFTPRRGSSSSSSSTPVSSPVLRSMIPSQPITSSKPWNCLTQRSIDECRDLISQAEQNWDPDRHKLFTPADRQAVAELLRVGKHLELQGTGIFIDLWPTVLSFCGRGWFEVEEEGSLVSEIMEEEEGVQLCEAAETSNDDLLSLPTF